MSGRCEKFIMCGEEHYIFPDSIVSPNAVYKRLPNGKYSIVGFRKTNAKTSNATKSKK